MSAIQEAVNATLNTPIKLDLGAGPNKAVGFIGIDQYAMNGVDIVTDLRAARWEFKDAPTDLKPRLKFDTLISDETTDFGLYSFADNSVDEARASHFLEHLTNFNDKWERVNFFNELHRILKPGAQCQLIFPHWASNRYYGDPTHNEPFSEMGFYYLKREWRLDQNNAPHADISVNPNGYSCDFDATWGYSLHPHLITRNVEYQQHALSFWKEAAQDIIATITKRPT